LDQQQVPVVLIDLVVAESAAAAVVVAAVAAAAGVAEVGTFEVAAQTPAVEVQ
jgi:hypothetical protein